MKDAEASKIASMSVSSNQERDFLDTGEKPFVFNEDKSIVEELAKNNSYFRILLNPGAEHSK